MESEPQSQLMNHNGTREHYSPLSKFPPLSLVDDYESQISLPLPTGTIVMDHNANNYFSINDLQPENPTNYPYEPSPCFREHFVIDNADQQSISTTNCAPSFSPKTLTNINSTTCNELYSSTASSNCVVFCKETSKSHSCPGCFRFIHIICGRANTEDDEGFGSTVWCPNCDIKEQNKNREQVRLGIKRNQECLHNRMLSCSNKRFKLAHVGESVLIPITRPDTMSSIAPRNLTGCITSKEDDMYTIGTSEGILASKYTRNQFDVCSSRILSIEDITCIPITQTEAMRKASLGIEYGSSCRCKFCKTHRCPCRKAGRSCNSKCHKGRTCFHKTTPSTTLTQSEI